MCTDLMIVLLSIASRMHGIWISGAGALAIWEAIRYAGRTLGLQRFDILASGVPSIERFIRDFAGRLTLAFIVDYERPSFSRDLRQVTRRLKAIITR